MCPSLYRKVGACRSRSAAVVVACLLESPDNFANQASCLYTMIIDVCEARCVTTMRAQASRQNEASLVSVHCSSYETLINAENRFLVEAIGNR